VNNRFQWAAWLVFIALAGCQTTPPPTTDVADAELRIEQAIAAEAQSHAPVELQFAQDKLARAQALIADKDFAAAMRLIAESRADADLAMVRATAARLRNEVTQKSRANDVLRSELMGGGGR
jgi:hypothetical protein